MRKCWTLTQVFLKTVIGSTMAIKIRGKESKWAGILLWVIVAASFFPILWSIYYMMGQLFGLFYAVGQLPVAIGLALNIGALLIFIFSLLAAPALFYFSKDVEFLLPLPVKAEQIIGAKFTMALAFEYIVSLGLMAIVFAVLLDYVPVGALTFSTIITFLTLPILPLVYSTVLVMLLMRVTRIIRNPDRYTLFVGVLAIGIAIGFTMYANQMAMFDMDALVDTLMGEPVAMTTLNTLFISNGFAARALGSDTIFGGALHNQVINLLITVAVVGVFFVLARLLYFAGVIGLSESGAPAKKMTTADIAKNTQGQSKFNAYLLKEMRLLLRSPSALINCVLSGLIMPIFLAISLVQLVRTGGLSELINLIDFSDPQLGALIMAGMCALGILMGGLVSATSTAISREGRNLFIMKYLPISYSTQLNAKASSGFVVLLPVILLMVIPVQVIFRAPALLFIGGLILTLLGATFVNYLSLSLDLMRPKLTWDNEQAAVKQNMNIIIMLFGTMSVAGGIGALGWFVLTGPWMAFFALFGVIGLLAVWSYYMAIGRGKYLLDRLH